jgi:hypothetical protein
MTQQEVSVLVRTLCETLHPMIAADVRAAIERATAPLLERIVALERANGTEQDGQ